VAGGSGGRALGQVVCVEQGGKLRPFMSLDDLERLAADDPAWLMKSLEAARTVFESIKDRPGVIYVLKHQL
jgi:hypothetical protein